MRYLTIVLALAIGCIARAQNDESEAYINQMLEEMAEDGLLSEDYEADVAELITLSDDKLDINTAGLEDFRKLFFLTEEQIETILVQRDRLGPFVSDVELLTVPKLRRIDVERLMHFAHVVPTNRSETRYKKAVMNVVGRVQRTFPEMRGFKAKNDSVGKAFMGGPYKSLARINGTIGDSWSGGLVMESDAGEPMFSHGISTTDMMGGYVAYTGKRRLVRKVVAGHYKAQFGQGLGLWTGFAANGSSVQTSVMRNGNGIDGNMSASECGYLRGLAATLGNTQTRISMFASHTDNDASTIAAMGNDSTEETELASSIQTSGYHRTVTEMARRNNYSLTLIGGYATRTWKRTSIGIGYNKWEGSKELANNGELYRAYYPTGKSISTTHADYRMIRSKVTLYGEIAYQGSGTLSGTQGMDLNLDGCAVTVAYRSFGKRYSTMYQNPVSRSSKAGGESGLYMGMSFCPVAEMEILANVDVYKHRWLRYLKMAPTSGFRARVNVGYKINEENQLNFRFKCDRYEDSDLDDRTLIEDTQRTGIKIQWSSEASKKIRFRTTIENVKYRQDNRKSDGFWISEDVTLSNDRETAKLTMQVAHFDTDDYYSRVYATQPDILYSMSLPSYSGRGVVATGYGQVKAGKSLSIWLWGSYLRYYDRESIGSSYSTIDSRHKIDIKLQFRIKLNYLKARITV